MGTGHFFRRFVVATALLAGGLGCEDRARPTFGAGGGEADGPTSLVTAPAELDTVERGSTFLLSVRVEDDDGVDSVWVTLSDSTLQKLSFSGGGETVATASYGPFIPNSFVSDSLVVFVRGVDLLGDTGAVYERHLIVQ